MGGDGVRMEGVEGRVHILRLAGEFRIAHGSTRERRVLRLCCGDAVAEAPFVPYYPDRVEEVEAWLRGGAARDAGSGVMQQGEMPRVIRTALDVLQHEVLALERGMPLWRSMNLPDPNGKPGCRSLGIPEDFEEFRERVRQGASQFPVLKLKLGSGDLEKDATIVSVAREVNPHGVMFVDVNGGWEVSEAGRMIPKLVSLGISRVEQPIAQALGVEGWLALRREIRGCAVEVYADESVGTVADLRALAGCVEGVNVKLLKTGGITGALELVREARRLGKGVLLGCMIESSLGVSAAAHLAGMADGIDLDGHLYLEADDFEGFWYDVEGRLCVPDRPGIGARAVPIKPVGSDH
jgi:L-alanine-DL-glutamate epimerase-like enolase superfamily enzyme